MNVHALPKHVKSLMTDASRCYHHISDHNMVHEKTEAKDGFAVKSAIKKYFGKGGHQDFETDGHIHVYAVDNENNHHHVATFVRHVKGPNNRPYTAVSTHDSDLGHCYDSADKIKDITSGALKDLRSKLNTNDKSISKVVINHIRQASYYLDDTYHDKPGLNHDNMTKILSKGAMLSLTHKDHRPPHNMNQVHITPDGYGNYRIIHNKGNKMIDHGGDYTAAGAHKIAKQLTNSDTDNFKLTHYHYY